MLDWIGRNWALKLVSLILAIGLWYYAVGEEGMQVTRHIPLEIEVASKQMSLLHASAETVQVTFMVPRALVADLSGEKVRLLHRIKEDVNKAGEYSFRLEPREIRIQTPQVHVLKIDPEVVQVTLDELIVKKVPVSANLEGDPAYGYQIASDHIELNPNAVLLEGPKGQLEKLEAVKTEKIDLVGRVRSFRRTMPLQVPPNIRLLGESLIDVYVPIQEQYEEKTLEGLKVKAARSLDSKEKIELHPDTVNFVLKGPRPALEKLSGDQILVFVETEGLLEGEHELEVRATLPEKVVFKDGKPPSVKVLVKK